MAYNKSVRLHSFLCGALAIILPTLFILSLIANTVSGEQLEELLGEGPARCVTLLTVSPQTGGGVLCQPNTVAECCYCFFPPRVSSCIYGTGYQKMDMLCL